MAKEYEIARITGVCTACSRQFEPEEEIVAAVSEQGDQLVRQDYCPPCWEPRAAQEADKLLGVWRTTVPRPQEKKKQLVDDEVLVNFLERLEGTEDPSKINFRFVLALVLMRKRVLIYDRMDKTADGVEIWTMHLKGSDAPLKIVNPQMDDEKIAEVSRQLGEIIPGAQEATT